MNRTTNIVLLFLVGMFAAPIFIAIVSLGIAVRNKLKRKRK